MLPGTTGSTPNTSACSTSGPPAATSWPRGGRRTALPPTTTRPSNSKTFTNFHKGRSKFPRFKHKGRGGSVRFMGPAVHLADSHHVGINRIGELKTYDSTRELYRHLDRDGQDHGRDRARALGKVDGLVQRRGDSTSPRHPGTREDHRRREPRHLVSAEKKLAHAQRIAARRQGPKPGAAPQRWKKAPGRVQQIHAGITNARKSLIHGTTTMLAKNYDVIVLEDLNVAGMVKNHSLAKHIADAAWGEFARQLEYKTAWYAPTLVRVGRFYPSSKTCSQYQTVKATLSLEMRMYHCVACGLTLDRDHNAAINPARQGLPGTSSGTGRGGEVRPAQQKLVATAHPDEASTDPSPEVDGVDASV